MGVQKERKSTFLTMSSRKQKYVAFGASFSESVKFFNESNFTQETDFFSE